jgi:DNA-binding FrmR family transcriptional regulator
VEIVETDTGHQHALGLLEEHLSHCVVAAAAAGGPEADEKVREASEAIARLVRS